MTVIGWKVSHSENSLLCAVMKSLCDVIPAGWLPDGGGASRRVGGVSGHLNPGGQQFRDDDGAADARVTAALAAYHTGQGSEQDALTALAAARLLVPVVAVLADGSAADGDTNSEMVLPTLIGQDGRPA